jgi:hypothetical protein
MHHRHHHQCAQMVDAGERAMAEEYRALFGLPESSLAPADPAVLAAEAAARAARYLQPPHRTLFVDSPGQLAEVGRIGGRAGLLWGQRWGTLGGGLAGQVPHPHRCKCVFVKLPPQVEAIMASATLVGLDVEWKPSHIGSSSRSGGANANANAGDAVGGGSGGSGDERDGAPGSGGEPSSGGGSGGTEAGGTEAGTGSGGAVGAQQAQQQARGTSPASLLQVATDDHTLVFDLLSLGGDPRLDIALSAAFHNPRCLKVCGSGCALRHLPL